MANMLSALENIQNKVRRLTRSPSEAQLSTTDLNNYINTFVLYDFPSQLRLFEMKTNFIFYTEPFIDTYSVNTTDPSDPLYNFQNLYITTDQPLYIAGYLSVFTQSQAQFYASYPKINFIQSIGVYGDGMTQHFTGIINTQQNTPNSNINYNQQINLLQNNVIFDSIDSAGNGCILVDYPTSSLTGFMGVPNTPGISVSTYGTINYVSGAFDITFPVAPAAGAPINSQVVPYAPARPQIMLYYDNQFVFRPVPDQPYKVEMEAFVRPTALLAGQSPQLEQWWQYISYGCAKKIFEDRMDLDSVQMIMPEFKAQEDMCLRTTLVQYTKQRVQTIYTEQTTNTFNWNGWGYGNGQL